ncbi:MAG: response regulator [Chloroflexota bacterium]
MVSVQVSHALVIDDEFNNRDFAEKLLQKAGLQVCSAASGAEALALVATLPHNTLVLIDHELPDTTGVQLIKKIHEISPDMMLVMATMHDHTQLIDEAFEAGVHMFLIKPNGFIELYRALLSGDNTILSRENRYIVDNYGPRKYKGAKKPVC